MAKAVPAWFPHAEPLLRVVKRTGLSRTAAVSLLERYRDANGVFPGQDADGMEAYAMSAWVMDLRRQIKNLDSKLEAKSAFPEAKKAGSVLGGWLGKKPAKEQATLESLHQEWVKGGKVKGATHESFFDTEYLLSEVKMQKEVPAPSDHPGKLFGIALQSLPSSQCHLSLPSLLSFSAPHCTPNPPTALSATPFKRVVP